jgi:hypothetical protein
LEHYLGEQARELVQHLEIRLVTRQRFSPDLPEGCPVELARALR